MLSDLFVNSTILISSIFLCSQLYRNKNKVHNSLMYKLLIGLFGGVLGIVLILYGIRVHDKTFVDFRYIPIVLLAFYASPLSTIISAVTVSSARIVFYGVSESSILGAAASITIALGCIWLKNLKVKKHLKFCWMFSYSLLILIIIYTLLLFHEANFCKIITIYCTLYIITGIAVYRLSEYVISCNALYNNLKEQASKDFLTGLTNVRQYDAVINEAFKRVQNFGEKLSILAVDIDHFKKVNDTYGHDGGDEVLKQLASVLLSSCRPFDIVARVGGEEFSVILLDCPNVQAVEVAERIRKSVLGHAFTLSDGNSIHISVSIGAATYPDSTENLEELKKQADIELYKAKESGRNKVCSFPNKTC